jgi:uncharacterized SAM-binding protein YcdF (DUF218 family)
VYALELAAIACIPLAAGLIRDWRDFGNAVMASVALTLAAFAAAGKLLAVHSLPAVAALVVLVLLIASGPLVICAYLLHNGMGLSPREPAPLPRVPSLLLGFAILIATVLGLVAQLPGSRQLNTASTAVFLLFGYVTAMFALFLLASRLRTGLRPRPVGDVVVVLGSGLGPGGQVSPLLASRLDRGRQVYESLTSPDRLLVVSGGKGSHDQVTEAEAMARYLLARGFPADTLMREEESRSTEENLANTAALIERVRPAASSVVVTSYFHVLRTAQLARRLDLDAVVVGAPAERERRWPNARIREFGATFLSYKINFAICVLAVAIPLTDLALRHLVPGGPRAALFSGS